MYDKEQAEMKKTAIKKIVINQSPKAQSTTAQASTEFLFILAAVLVITLSAAVITQQQFFSIQITKAESDAKNTVKSLGTAALEVYAQGEGAKKRIYLQFPSNYDFNNSYIRNSSIVIRAGGADFHYNTRVNISGTLPYYSGNHWVWVISEGSRVRIGNALITTNKPAINIIMDRNSTRLESFSITNIAGSPLNITLAKAWNASSISFSLSGQNFTLAVNQIQTIILSFSSDSNARGIYNGEVVIAAVSDSNNETLYIPVTIEVISQTTDKPPPLFIIPSIWNATLLPNQSVTKEFQVCTNSETSVPYVRFSATAGAAGAWVGGMQQLPAIAANTCLSKIFNLSAPAGTAFGQYTGSILADGGSLSAQAAVSLITNVGDNSTDNTGPNVTNIRKANSLSLAGRPITINATGDDSQTGNRVIRRCEQNLNNGTWSAMLPVDGIFDSPREEITITHPALDYGFYYMSIRCTDSNNNVGPPANFSFTMLRDIMFLTKDEGAGVEEQAWQDWISIHSSGENFPWAYDVYSKQYLLNNPSDKFLYAVIFMVDYSDSSALRNELLNYTTRGGYILIADKAMEKAPQALGISNLPTKKDHDVNIYINNPSHYITQSFTDPTQIYTVNTNQYMLSNDFNGDILAIFNFNPVTVTMGERHSDKNILIFGATKPYRFTIRGHDLMTRVLDYTIKNTGMG